MELFKVTEAIKANHAKGKAWKNKKKKKKKSSESVRSYETPYSMTSKSLEEGMTIEEVKKLYGFLNSHKEKINKYNIDSDGDPTEDYVLWLENGANAALAWSHEILKSNDIVKLGEVEPDAKDAEENSRFTQTEVKKSSDGELMQATYVVLEPQDGEFTDDLHGDTYTEEEVRKACHNFNSFCRKANLLHLCETDSFSFVESYIAPVDFVLGEEFVKKGSWLATIQVHDEEIWELVKSNQLNGLSIQGLAKTEYLDEQEAT